LDYSKLTFASQFMSGGFNTNVASGEGFAGKNNYTNFNVGAMYQRNTETERAYFGLAAFNFLDEKLSFTKAGFVENVAMRYAINGGYNKLLDNRNAFSVSSNFMYQAGSYDAIAGAAYSWFIPTENTYQANYFTAGAWYRLQDAVIPYVGLSWGDLQIGLSYDIVTNGVKLSTPKNGSFELSLIFTGQRSEKGIKCPSF
jgi:type IX secretion system PorP/SprF family membrane protein